ncbi:hypothetical protein HMPREF9004_0779 [Schaalia cardiffensis F0333]|uniref:Uncharacterized protein n=1 Tax=Schaalia cardiffensis F0333 TaxID=888050 RepID=N6X527_9ACTO|nr:hypothetical protein HMPREF9004_0779 [Schaalia cardiffensis F0333]
MPFRQDLGVLASTEIMLRGHPNEKLKGAQPPQLPFRQDLGVLASTEIMFGVL